MIFNITWLLIGNHKYTNNAEIKCGKFYFSAILGAYFSGTQNADLG